MIGTISGESSRCGGGGEGSATCILEGIRIRFTEQGAFFIDRTKPAGLEERHGFLISFVGMHVNTIIQE